MSNNIQHIVIGRAEAEVVVKRSRFIATVCEVHTEDEAVSLINELKKQYWDARHNCYAYVLGEKSQISRFSDDKEPQGTAGKPILEAITRSGHTNTLIVVTRYFGGILLGAGGLTRAYSQSASEGLAASSSFPLLYGKKICVKCDYSSSGKIGHIVETQGAALLDTEYAEDVTLSILSEEKNTPSLIKKITEATGGKASVDTGNGLYFYVSDGKAGIYSF